MSPNRPSNRRISALGKFTRICMLVLMVGTLLVALWKTAPDKQQLAIRNDEFCEGLLRGPHTAEARKWFAEMLPGKPRTVGEFGTTAESVAEMESFYAAGAVRVMLVEIDDYNGMGNTGKLVVSLPSDTIGRAKVFALSNKWATQQGFDANADNGQKYVYVSLD